MPYAHRYPLPQDMGKVMHMPLVKGRQIRDGPRRCRQQRNEMLPNDLGKAA